MSVVIAWAGWNGPETVGFGCARGWISRSRILLTGDSTRHESPTGPPGDLARGGMAAGDPWAPSPACRSAGMGWFLCFRSRQLGFWCLGSNGTTNSQPAGATIEAPGDLARGGFAAGDPWAPTPGWRRAGTGWNVFCQPHFFIFSLILPLLLPKLQAPAAVGDSIEGLTRLQSFLLGAR